MIIGVTGTFGTGKTTVSMLFKRMGAKVIDADKIVHQLYKTDKEIKKTLLKTFGREVFRGHKVDRKKLAKVAFSNRRNLKKLCRLTHPAVLREIRMKSKDRRKKITVIDAPLLIEAKLHKRVDYVIVVKATFEKSIERCKKRGLKKKEILARRASQMPLEQKIKYADFVIDNNRSKRYTSEVVNGILKKITRGVKYG